MGRRTEIQIALLIAGVLVWGYGQRTDREILQYIGIAFFLVATVLRLLRGRFSNRPNDPSGPHE